MNYCEKYLEKNLRHMLIIICLHVKNNFVLLSYGYFSSLTYRLAMMLPDKNPKTYVFERE